MSDFTKWDDRKLLRYIGQVAELQQRLEHEQDARAAAAASRLASLRRELRGRPHRAKDCGGES